MVTFKFKDSNGNIKEVEISSDIIIERCMDEAYELLANCECEPVGETNVIECSCDEDVSDYDFVEAY
jgi:hypothetical protein